MIKTLLQNGGVANQNKIAREILMYDISQIEYYENITNNMVGRVLRNHEVVHKNKKNYYLEGFELLTKNEITELIEICNQKISEFIENRGQMVFEHRRRNRRAVTGSIRYKVLTRAKFRCELCGISAEEKALEVDHITPKNSGGEDSINNYQALCYTCNAQKKDSDDTDFRGFKTLYDHRMRGCVFCDFDQKNILTQNNLAFAFKDEFPVTNLHTLIVPRRHVVDYFDLTQPEINATTELIRQVKKLLISDDNTISGFNIGVNIGQDAGQTIFHCHIHMIPRRTGDVENPIGGVRHLIPGRGRYPNK
ncbi:MAG: HIT domain-containing protein [Bacteroidetes bacterium]|nr:HIT domain-containing protein [Bacteroidota bacterium]